ncbi:hypothetical protein BDV96DRAFT_605149 [Lophiotrema nucula]|uniref:Uncharacterized protein n=1 Tax=Lophiotrema nucula TaxID=690887 RepID=A0A6A5YSL6_9PLEO|nr:hypothetical protein BDV96DRAFT_605149 [Lophiotrema nucula]
MRPREHAQRPRQQRHCARVPDTTWAHTTHRTRARTAQHSRRPRRRVAWWGPAAGASAWRADRRGIGGGSAAEACLVYAQGPLQLSKRLHPTSCPPPFFPSMDRLPAREEGAKRPPAIGRSFPAALAIRAGRIVCFRMARGRMERSACERSNLSLLAAPEPSCATLIYGSSGGDDLARCNSHTYKALRSPGADGARLTTKRRGQHESSSSCSAPGLDAQLC